MLVLFIILPFHGNIFHCFFLESVGLHNVSGRILIGLSWITSCIILRSEATSVNYFVRSCSKFYCLSLWSLWFSFWLTLLDDAMLWLFGQRQNVINCLKGMLPEEIKSDIMWMDFICLESSWRYLYIWIVFYISLLNKKMMK